MRVRTVELRKTKQTCAKCVKYWRSHFLHPWLHEATALRTFDGSGTSKSKSTLVHAYTWESFHALCVGQVNVPYDVDFMLLTIFGRFLVPRGGNYRIPFFSSIWLRHVSTDTKLVRTL